jgi:hypothetical protein
VKPLYQHTSALLKTYLLGTEALYPGTGNDIVNVGWNGLFDLRSDQNLQPQREALPTSYKQSWQNMYPRMQESSPSAM